MAQPPTRTYLLLEERLGEPLAPLVETARDAGHSWNRIATDLFTRTQVLITSETLRLWFAERERAA